MKKDINYKIKDLSLFTRILLKPLMASLIIFISLWAYPSNKKYTCPPPGSSPLYLSVSIHINNIYNINTVDETYQVDGYLVYRWLDERLEFDPDTCLSDPKIYINDRARDYIDEVIWFPTCEFVNVQGSRASPNIRVEVNSNGHVLYTERFFETFIANMDYRGFPFDTQLFNIIIEPWGYNKKIVAFTNPQLFPKLHESGQMIDKWIIDTMYSRLDEKIYDHLGHSDQESRTWSRVAFEIKAKRMSGYFVWQVLFPLAIIIMASFVIFWIHDFAVQVGIGFTLMLTVVAFNFYSASILPKLPYNTFIESIIIVGYVFIFLGILAVIISYKLHRNKKKQKKNTLLQLCKVFFPLAFFITMGILYFNFNFN